jgi:hypothetical protein
MKKEETVEDERIQLLKREIWIMNNIKGAHPFIFTKREAAFYLACLILSLEFPCFRNIVHQNINKEMV